ncbi:MAG: cation transporter [Eubacterium sp.]|nr:cation transporter [Eubacterium sp.]
MKKKFKVVDVDCANCAAKMESLIKKIDGVNDASLNFMTQKLMLDADDARFDEIVKEADACMRKVDSGARIDL